MEPDLVREDFLLKGEQELFRQSGLFLDKGTAYTKPRGREFAQGGAQCQHGSSTQAGKGQLARGQVRTEQCLLRHGRDGGIYLNSGREPSWLKQKGGSQIHTFKKSLKLLGEEWIGRWPKQQL